MTGLAHAIRDQHPISAAGGAADLAPLIPSLENTVLYDLYPEWGPASHDPQNPRSLEAVQAALDLRDGHGPIPDDN